MILMPLINSKVKVYLGKKRKIKVFFNSEGDGLLLRTYLLKGTRYSGEE